MFRQIAKITIKADLTNLTNEYSLKNDSRPWNENGDSYIKDNDVTRYTIKKTPKNNFSLLVEEFDLFNTDPGEWTKENHPELDSIVKEALDTFEKSFNCKISLIHIERKIL